MRAILRDPTWSVVSGGGTINAVSGLFTAGPTTGTFTNTAVATSSAISGQATVIVSLGTLATITVTPDPASMSPGQTQSFTAVGRDASNNIMAITPVWSVTAGGGTINALSGLWTAGTAVTGITGGHILADVSISPGNTITGFGACLISGTQHLADGPAAAGQLDLTTADNVVLINGAQAKNVFWPVGTSATIGTASQWKGNILALTSITLVENANLIGRALARNGAVSFGTDNVISLP